MTSLGLHDCMWQSIPIFAMARMVSVHCTQVSMLEAVHVTQYTIITSCNVLQPIAVTVTPYLSEYLHATWH